MLAPATWIYRILNATVAALSILDQQVSNDIDTKISQVIVHTTGAEA